MSNHFISKFAFTVLISLIFICIGSSVVLGDEPVAEHLHDDFPEAVSQVQAYWDAGEINKAEMLALRTLDRPTELARFDQFHLQNILAFCAIAKDDLENGKLHFISALRLNPSMTADPVTWSPKVRRVFDTARREYLETVKGERESRRAHIADICRQASLSSLYLPGSGQFSKGYKLQGVTLGVVFWSAAATFLYSQLILPQVRQDYLDASGSVEALSSWREYRDVYQMSIVSGSIAAGVYTIGFFDALWRDTPPDSTNSIEK